MRIPTFSIVACDIDAGEWGVAVASKFLAVGSVVPSARAKVGAVATQALANITFGPRGLELLERGRSARDALDELVASDDGAQHRQVGVVDAKGGSATYTGTQCLGWAGGVSGEGCAIQGNILTGPEVVDSMRESFLSSTGRLADRLLSALYVGDRAGGDKRGRQSAAIFIAREGGGYGAANDHAVDLRVDDHADPVVELQRLRAIHSIYFESPKPDDFVDIDETLAFEIREILQALSGFVGSGRGYDAETADALKTLMGVENLEMKWVEGNRIDGRVLHLLRSKVVH